MQNIDKIAYGVVAVIVIGLCALPFLMGGEGDATKSVQDSLAIIDDKLDQQEVEALHAPNLRRELESIEPTAAPQDFGEWVFYRRPARVEKKATIIRVAAVHEGPRIRGVELNRDAAQKRAVFRITGKAGESKHVKGLRIYLDKQQGDGDWTQIDDQLGVPGEDFEFEWNAGEHGKDYRFRVRSKAESDTSVPLGGDEKERSSVESDAVVVPFDEWLRASSASVSVFGNNGLNPGRVSLVKLTWNYAEDKIDRDQQTVVEANLEKGEDWKQGPKIFGTELRLESIKEKKIDGKTVTVVTLRDPANFRRSKVELIVGEKAPDMTTQGWINPDAGDDDAGLDGEGMEDDAASGDADPEPEPDDDDEGGSGLFGGGDDED